MKIRSSLTALMLALSLSACGYRPKVLIPPAGHVPTDLRELLAQHPLAAEQNIRSVPLASTEAASTHLVQIRQGESPHRHARHDLVVTMLRGKGTLHVGDQALPMQASDVAVIPRGVAHYFVNEDRDPAVAFVTFAPPYDGKDQVPVP